MLRPLALFPAAETSQTWRIGIKHWLYAFCRFFAVNLQFTLSAHPLVRSSDAVTAANTLSALPT
jgi:hypothetical protein